MSVEEEETNSRYNDLGGVQYIPAVSKKFSKIEFFVYLQ